MPKYYDGSSFTAFKRCRKINMLLFDILFLPVVSYFMTCHIKAAGEPLEISGDCVFRAFR
jgi:hypothetical protein